MAEKSPKKSGIELLFLGYTAHFISRKKWSKWQLISEETKRNVTFLMRREN